MQNRENEQRIDRILESLDGLQKASAPDFFYTRLSARMENEMLVKRKARFILRPAFVTAALSVVLILNIIFLTQGNKQPVSSANDTPKGPATIESFAKAYNLDASSLYE